ncbi:MAG TPA: hypothetical protein VGS07_05765 [Thermoanaerobaculia bacterium]|nr:hypothetical protein [Thermoanaerobaculia bacterium]
MRKTKKRLTLNRETLRHLEENTLMAPYGGAVTDVDCTLVNGSCISTSCAAICTTRAAAHCTSAAGGCTTTP